MKIRLLCFLLGASILTGCAGFLGRSTPKETEELEEVGTRRASPDEEKRLDTCLHYLYEKQKSTHARFGRYARELKKLDVDDKCEHIKLKMESTVDTYTATATIRDKDSVVRWTVNNRGEVEEHDDLSFDFSL